MFQIDDPPGLMLGRVIVFFAGRAAVRVVVWDRAAPARGVATPTDEVLISTPLLLFEGIQVVAIAALVVQGRRRARVEQSVRESQERFRLVADRAPVMIWTARPDTTLDYLNRYCTEFTGLPLERLLDNGWLDAVHPDDVEGCVGTYTPAIEARRPVRVEYRLRRADGAYRWVFDSGVPSYAPNGDFLGYVGACLDITERREAEDGVRDSRAALERSHDEIRHLAGRLIEAQDAERSRIARDLHDDVSQQLAGVSIGLSRLRHRMEALGAAKELQEDLVQLHDTATTLAQSVRHLSHDLHPTVLQHAGLEVALATHCAELERLHGTAFQCQVAGDFQSMDEASALCLYRIAQEALRNVVAHAAARRADVSLTRSNGHAELVITDDGAGFHPAGSFARSSGLGLVSIAERVRLAGGTIAISSAPGSGTAVRASIPVRTAQA